MREPSLHITRSAFHKLITYALDEHNIPRESHTVDALVNYIMKRGVNYSLSNRTILTNLNERAGRKASRVTKVPKNDALLFSNTLNLVRTQLKHRGLTKYTPEHTDWEFIVELSHLANAFCESFGLIKEKGYREYIKMFFTARSGVFKLRQMKAFHESIVQRYACVQEIDEDVNPEDTRKAHDLYIQTIFEKTGMSNTYDKYPDKYVFFVRVSAIAKELGVSVEDYIIGNFESLASFSTGIPAPEQLVTPNGKDRVIRWIAENRTKRKSKVDLGVLEEFSKRKAKHNEDSDF